MQQPDPDQQAESPVGRSLTIRIQSSSSPGVVRRLMMGTVMPETGGLEMRVKIWLEHCSGSWAGQLEWEAEAPTLEEAVAACREAVMASRLGWFRKQDMPTAFNWPNRVSLGNTQLVMYDTTNWRV